MIAPVKVGERLDRFRIQALVARSGMASIFRALDESTGLTVAIKIPHPEMEMDPLFFDRFHREAAIGKKLDHPGVVNVLDIPDQSRVYMAMEWVEGRPLREILDRDGKLPQHYAVQLGIAVCDALAYIHEHGIVHRDLKPDNIMVDGDRIKLIDFGIARDPSARRLTFGKLTKLVGTPDYVAPEQVRGKRGDGRTDIYTMGVILFEMLTAQLPFQGENPLAAMNQRLVTPPIAARTLDPSLSLELEEILHRAMERAPERRYANAREMAHDLAHPEAMSVAELRAARTAPRTTQPRLQWSWSYLALMLIPAAILALMFLVAHWK